LLPKSNITAVEINRKAFEKVSELPFVNALNQSIYDFQPKNTSDFVFTKGVLIHQNPELLPKAYDLLYSASSKYIFVCEYFNPSPVEVTYRGNTSVLFKRDFAGEILDRFTDLKLIEYGFVYHRDNNFPGDDFTWFLMEKNHK
jgi:spore coat polysaccharide biosynthesis protein SpsF